jgi:high-affinity Fe2+/Pb2+ permease
MGTNKQLYCITVAILTLAVGFGLGTGWLDRQARLIFDSALALQVFSIGLRAFVAVGLLVWLGAFEFHRAHTPQTAHDTES